VQYRFYELTGDLQDTLHFRHFESSRPTEPRSNDGQGHVRLKSEVKLKDQTVQPTAARVRLRD
jgi:hypothetical protein